MAAAAWTEHAKDITGDRKSWNRYLNAAQLSHRINLSEATILDILTRTPRKDDPRSAIYRPAARIGQTKLSAVPLWTAKQAERYNTLASRRPTGAAARRPAQRTKLPVIPLAQAAEQGLASTNELARDLGIAENSIRRWAREESDFPAEVGEAERQPPFQFGPPRVLRRTVEVRAWVLANARLDKEHRAALESDQERDLAGVPAA